jgi:Carboxypeptidase regulatory-like domain
MHIGKFSITRLERNFMKKSVVSIAILGFVLIWAIMQAQAATLTVTNISDSGSGSLRQTIINASNGDTIIFAANLSGSIILNSEISINKSLFVNGSGANILGVEGINNGLDVRVFRVTSGSTTISNLRIANGFSSGAGGGILVDGGNLTLNNCILNGNIAESGGGVIVFTGSTLTITNSTITGNESFVEGGGVSNRGGTLILNNATITGNIAPQGGGVSVEGGGTTTILNCTITNNGDSAPQTGDIGGLRIGVGATANLKNTIVGNNIGSPTAPTDVGGIVNSLGNNLIGNTTGGFGFTAFDLLNLNPLLGILSNNGGTTPTQALITGSPAIDMGNNSGAPVTDQRGVVRPQNALVDIGAFESGVAAWNGATNTGTNITTTMGTVSTNFSVVGTAGTTTAVPINPADAGTVPSGYSLGTGFPAYEISTTAIYTAPIRVCIQVSSTTPLATFNALRILHYVNGTPTDATILLPNSPTPDFATKTICANVSTLSPFVVAQNLAPTASNVSISGRVTKPKGQGISRVRMSITDQNGEIRFATTNSFGFYRFAELSAGQTYIIGASHKRYQFNSQVITVSEDLQGIDFTAEP